MARPKRANSEGPKNLIGERVRIARLAHKPAFDQADLAAALASELGYPIGRTTVVRLEAASRPVTDIELIALARILNVDILWLLLGKS